VTLARQAPQSSTKDITYFGQILKDIRKKSLYFSILNDTKVQPDSSLAFCSTNWTSFWYQYLSSK